MKSTEFVEKQLKFLKEKIDGIEIRYEYRSTLSTYLIEILPLEIFENDIQYIDLEMQIMDAFEFLHGAKKEILFVSKNSLMEVTKGAKQI